MGYQECIYTEEYCQSSWGQYWHYATQDLPSTATFLYYTKYEEYTWYSFEIGAWNIVEP